MGEELRSVSLCLLDDVNMSDVLKLDEFEIRYYQPAELQTMVLEEGTGNLSSDVSDRLAAYAMFPWARFERSIPPNKVKTNLDQRLQQLDLSWNHAGTRSWWPFDDLLRTLNLLKPAGGPVIGRQFYCWLAPLVKPDRRTDRIIYGEPLWDYDGPENDDIPPLVFAYDLEPSDTERFSQLRKQLAQCLAAGSKPDNSHLRTAIHYFENGDRKIVPHPLPGSSDAIEPLMSYEAALEALLVPEKKEEGGVENKLSTRIAALAKKKVNGITDNKAGEIENFTKRVFWLRSKVAHGARPIEEIENLIIHKSNDKILDNERNKCIPKGGYASLLIQGGPFPGFLVNLRELTRICICFFCEEFSAGQYKERTIALLEKTD